MSADRVERRLAAILAADVAGYSRLIGADEEGTLARLRAIRRELVDPKIGEHRGRIVKTTGDGLLIEFASVVDALRCAVEVQQAMRQKNADILPPERIEFRIGIHQGDIVVEDGDIFGDGVNVAARLEGISEPGGICVSARVQEDAAGRVNVEFEDIGEPELKNITRRVRAYRIHVTDSAPTTLGSLPNVLEIQNKPSIAVFPFQNMSGDPDQEYFADGMVEDIITALSRFRSLFVIARNTSSTYKGKAIDIKQVGRELGVRYVLEGSVRRAGGRVRITGQLIDTETGAHLWADKIDGTLEDVFELQDRVASSVVGAIAPAVELAESERAKRKPPANLDSYDLYLRGSAAVWAGHLREAITYFKRAIEKDPELAPAYGLCAGAYVVLQAYTGVPISREEQAEAVRFANLAATLGTDDALTLVRAAQALAKFDQQYERALAMSDRAVGLNPSFASIWLIHGWVNHLSSRHQESINSFSRVLQFPELDPARIGAYSGIAYGSFYLRRYDEGCAWAEKALQKYENTLYLIPLVANAIRAGRTDEARGAVVRLLRIVPSFRMSRFHELFNSREGDEPMARALRDAGLPE